MGRLSQSLADPVFLIKVRSDGTESGLANSFSWLSYTLGYISGNDTTLSPAEVRSHSSGHVSGTWLMAEQLSRLEIDESPDITGRK